MFRLTLRRAVRGLAGALCVAPSLLGVAPGVAWATVRAPSTMGAAVVRTVLQATQPLPAAATVGGAVPSETQLQVTVTLAPRDPSALAAYAGAVSNPGSGDYQDYLTVSRSPHGSARRLRTRRSSARRSFSRPASTFRFWLKASNARTI